MKKLTYAFICLLLAVPCQARTIYVDDDGPADFDNIQEAVNDSNDGDTIIVAPGTYTGLGNRDIDFLGKAITVRSETGPENCIIDCNGTEEELHRGFYFHSGEGSDSVLDGFTITNGCAHKGGAIWFRYSSSPTIINCIIRGNLSPYAYVPDPFLPMIILQDGGGIYCSESSPIIKKCYFIENTATSGGGAIYSWRGNALVDSCVFINNRADLSGGAIGLSGANMSIHNCVITGNSAGGSVYYYDYGGGGAISCFRGTPIISNCTISENRAISCVGGGISSDAIVVTNCILWGNEPDQIFGRASVAYSDIQDGWSGVGNIDADPYFVEPGYWADANDPNIVVEPNDLNAAWVDGNYHLLPDSPCINAGDPNYVPEPNETDLDGNPRVNGGRIDMGAYESIMHEAHLRLWPRLINRKSYWPRTITAWLRLPQGITKDQIDIDTPLILYPGGIKAIRQFVIQKRRRFSKHTSIFAFFDKAELTEVIDTNGPGQLQVLGHLLDPGQYFYGSDTIRIIAPWPPHWPPQHWR